MKLFQSNPLRILGIPVGFDALISKDARLSQFEPENPQLLIPRRAGIGWDINFGAVAVRLGLIRPDDSLPDLENYIPSHVVSVLSASPFVSAIAVGAASVATARRFKEIPAKRTLTLRPKKWKPAREVVLPLALASVGFAGWDMWVQHRENSVDVVSVALTNSFTAVALLSLAAGWCDARAEEESRCKDADALHTAAIALSAASIAALPVVMLGTEVATVKSALQNVKIQLRQQQR